MIKKSQIVEKNEKLVTFLQDFGLTYADCNKILRNKDVKVNGKAVKENVALSVGDEVTFFLSSEMLRKKYDVIFENDDAVIVYKFAGIESDGEKGLEGLLTGAMAVHRLDRNTEGLMVFAKNDRTKSRLDTAFKNRLVHKKYIAEVVGKCDLKEKVYKAFLLKDEQKSVVKIFQNEVRGYKPIETKIKPLKVGEKSSLVEVELLTGRTHQIRAHLAYLGFPIVGDGKYGKNETNKKFGRSHQMLACVELQFDHVDVTGLDGKIFQKYPNWLQTGKNLKQN